MSEAVKIALIVAIAPTIAGIAGVIAAIMSHQSTKNAIVELHLQINSRMNELLLKTSELGRAEGVASEQERQKNT